MTGLAVTEAPPPAEEEQPADRSQVVRELALDLQQALARKGRAPFVLSGLPMVEDLSAIHQTLAHCLALAEDPHLRHWYTVLGQTLPHYQPAFDEVQQALDWAEGIHEVLEAPLPTSEEPGAGGDMVARQLAHHLGQEANRPDRSPWQKKFRDEVWALSERYWSGLFHCYDIAGLPATNNDHESLYGQTKRQMRRQLGVSELREPLLRRGAWTIFRVQADSPAELEGRLAQVSWEDYAVERTRYERRQAQFRHRYRWRHQRDNVLQERISGCLWLLTCDFCRNTLYHRIHGHSLDCLSRRGYNVRKDNRFLI